MIHDPKFKYQKEDVMGAFDYNFPPIDLDRKGKIECSGFVKEKDDEKVLNLSFHEGSSSYFAWEGIIPWTLDIKDKLRCELSALFVCSSFNLMIYFIIDNKKVQSKKHGLIQKYQPPKKKRKQKKDTMNQKHTWFINNIKSMQNQKKLHTTNQNKRQKKQKRKKPLKTSFVPAHITGNNLLHTHNTPNPHSRAKEQKVTTSSSLFEDLPQSSDKDGKISFIKSFGKRKLVFKTEEALSYLEQNQDVLAHLNQNEKRIITDVEEEEEETPTEMELLRTKKEVEKTKDEEKSLENTPPSSPSPLNTPPLAQITQDLI